ncbi:unnamed protein product [Clonostachys solani]|uniref:Uncharacterized protein n=1 Tax=Clonostachys solani TaxID=160281 RepID=A0A9N9YUJ7_9HYPO|nr:unnamed protein product [Clonostachys solani]
MSSYSAQDSLQHLLPYPENKSTKDSTVERRPLPPKLLHIKRSLVLLLVPFIVVGYYCLIWKLFILRDRDAAVNYGISGERWIFYSWFIVGVFALEWSRYGLAGAECAALQSRWLRSNNMVGLLNHSGSTWSDPGGWGLSFTRFVNSEEARQAYTGWYGVFKSLKWGIFNPLNWVAGMGRVLGSLQHYKLWYLLTLLSLSFYIGLPLSGITMELSNGYVKTKSKPEVVGRTWENLHSRAEWFYTPSIQKAWEVGSPATVPGIGIIYTAGYIDRSRYKGLQSVPNTLPMTDGLPEMFLAPQGRNPVSGRAWGFRVSYNCSIVEKASQFTLLSPQHASENQYLSVSTYSHNVHAYVEVASRVAASYEAQTTFDSEAASQWDIFEYVMWQLRLPTGYREAEVSNFNSKLDPVIQDMASPFEKSVNGSWNLNNTYFGQPAENTTLTSDQVKETEKLKTFLPNWLEQSIDLAPPIGLRCLAASTFGDADLDPRTSTFSSFEERIPRTYLQSNDAVQPVARLGRTVTDILSKNYIALFSSINSRTMSAYSNSMVYGAFITPQELQKSAMLAYGTEALQLMYDGKYGFEGSWIHPNLSSSVESKIITRGEVPALVAVIPFGIWALGSILLALFFGFRKRRGETLDGFSFYRLGAHHSSRLKADVISLLHRNLTKSALYGS